MAWTVQYGGEDGTTKYWYDPQTGASSYTEPTQDAPNFETRPTASGGLETLNPQTGQWERSFRVGGNNAGTSFVPESLSSQYPDSFLVEKNAPTNNVGWDEKIMPMALAALTTYLTGGAGAGVANSMFGGGMLGSAGSGALAAGVTGQNPATGAVMGAMGNAFNGATGASPDLATTANSTMSPDYMVNTGSNYASNMDEALAAMQQGAQSGQTIANSGLGNQFAQTNTGTAISQGSGALDPTTATADWMGEASTPGSGTGSIFNGIMGNGATAAGTLGVGAAASGLGGSDAALANGDLAGGGTTTGAVGNMNSLGQVSGLVGQGALTGAAGVTLQQLLKDPTNTELWKSVLGGTNGSYNLGGVLTGGLAGLLSANANNTAAGQVQDTSAKAAAAADPFASQRGFYQGELKNMYTDPNYFANNGILKAANDNAVNDTSRAMAAQGYNMSGNVPFAIAQRLQGNNMGYAKDLLQTTGNLAGANIQPSGVSNAIMQGGTAGANATTQNSGTLGNVLGSIFTGNSGSTSGSGGKNQNLSQFLFG